MEIDELTDKFEEILKSNDVNMDDDMFWSKNGQGSQYNKLGFALCEMSEYVFNHLLEK